MNRKRANFLLTCWLIAGAHTLCTRCAAQIPDQQPVGSSASKSRGGNSSSGQPNPEDEDLTPPQSHTDEGRNDLGVPFLKNLISDQKAIWTSPTRLRWADGTWLFPLAAV